MEGSESEIESHDMPSNLDSGKKVALQQSLKTTLQKTSKLLEKNSVEKGECSINIYELCIYRVPSQIRDKKPGAYTPQKVVIGPFHRKKPTNENGAKTSGKPWHIKQKYRMMEDIKKKYLEYFTQTVGKDNIEVMRKFIADNKIKIWSSYNETREWIKKVKSEDFVDLILHDSVFIVVFIFRYHENEKRDYGEGNIVDKFPFNSENVKADLILLENQLPFFILDRFFDIFIKSFPIPIKELSTLILGIFGLSFLDLKGNFKHFTDMFYCVYEDSLESDIREEMIKHPSGYPDIKELRNASNLSQSGVDFKSSENLDISEKEDDLEFSDTKSLRGMLKRTSYSRDKKKQRVKQRQRAMGYSLHVEFEKGTLWMPEFHANEKSDNILRNVIAYEQCHTALTPFTSNYIHFLNFLITSDRDVELLIDEGLVKKTGRPSFVVEMVNKLKDGVRQDDTSQYHFIAERLKAYCKSRRKKYWATLNKVYFSDLWTGTATTAAVLLLFMTLVSTVASVIQTYASLKQLQQPPPTC